MWLYYLSGDSIKETNFKCKQLGPLGKLLKPYLSSDYFIIKEMKIQVNISGYSHGTEKSGYRNR